MLARWAVSTDNCSREFADDIAFTNLLSLAVMESGDAYAAVKWLDDVARWEVETALVHLFDRVYASIDPITLLREREWVMQNAIRFPADAGQQVIVLIGGERFLGYVQSVERAVARALVNIGPPEHDATLWVNAEDVVEVVS